MAEITDEDEVILFSFIYHLFEFKDDNIDIKGINSLLYHIYMKQ